MSTPNRNLDRIAAGGLVVGAGFGLAGTFASSWHVQASLWATWTPTGGVVRTNVDGFRQLPPAGLAQGVWNFRVEPSGTGTKLTTETRVRCADAATRRQFLRYWRIMRLGSGLIRRSMLRHIRATAERQSRLR